MLSVIITTSPIKSNPSTKMIDEVITSLNFEDDWQIIVVCDGYKISEKQELKSGMINEKQAKNYLQYIENLKSICPPNFEILLREQRCGFAENVYFALKKCIFEFVLVVQHDFVFVQSIDFEALIKKYFIENNINYLTFKSNGKDNRSNYIEQNTEILPLLFLYDRNHLVRKSFYLETVFKKYKVKNFIEDSFGQFMKTQLKANIADFDLFRTYILNSKKNILKHVHGRKQIGIID
ncbi:MAG: hypothetical protein EAZ97_12185 [Bacteroidetes bacterium]|nr:MAG: hypothetical protein EAZ97_12185 [Bacteroidota bacterium]